MAAQLSASTSTTFQARIDLSEVYSSDDQTSRHVSFTEARALLDSRRLLGVEHLELHFDGRVRKTWTDIIEDRFELSRGYLQLGGDDTLLRLAVGRIAIASVASARVDGGQLAFSFDPRLSVGIFGGTSPHPFTGAFDRRFLIFGSGYEWRSSFVNNAGGGAVQLFSGALDRVYATERVYWVLSPEWMIFGLGIADFVPAPDLTNGNVSVRFRPSSMFDVSVSAMHFHAIVPNLWWRDWILEERLRRGFVVDGEDPLGTQRTGVRVVTNLHATSAITPYAIGRWDRRHEDAADAYEAQLGVKYDAAELGFLDVSATERRSFDADARLASLTLSVQAAEAIMIDVQGTMMKTTSHLDRSSLMLWDVGGSLWFDCRALSADLSGLRLLGQYQAFIDPLLTYHVVFARLSWDLER